MNIPQSEINRLQPTVRNEFLRWDDYMYSHIRFNMPDSEIHATAHCERVLLYALILGDDILTRVRDKNLMIFNQSKDIEYWAAFQGRLIYLYRLVLLIPENKLPA